MTDETSNPTPPDSFPESADPQDSDLAHGDSSASEDEGGGADVEPSPSDVGAAEPDVTEPVEAREDDGPAEEEAAGEEPAEEDASEPEPAEEESVAAADAEEEPAGELQGDSDAGEEPGEESPGEAPEEPSNKHWYVVKVQSGREESIKDAIERRVRIEGLEEFFGQIIIPTEKVKEMRTTKQGKTVQVVRSRKLYPGYLMVEVEYNDRILYLFRETTGVGDFVGGTINRPPPPMPPREVERMLGNQGKITPEIQYAAKSKFSKGDRVKVKDGTFSGMEGEVKEILETKGLVRVELTIFGRPVPVELEYWQIEQV